MNLGDFIMPFGEVVFFDKMIKIRKQGSFLMIGNTMINGSNGVDDDLFHDIKHDTMVTEFPLMLPFNEPGIFRSNGYGISFFARMV